MILVDKSLSRFFLVIFFLLFTNCSNNHASSIIITGNTMGTTYSITILDSITNENHLKKSIDKRLNDISMIFSTYLDSSEISKVNRFNGQKIHISDTFANVLNKALYYCNLSNGSYDITIGPLMNLWGFSNIDKNDIPNNKMIANTLSEIGYDKIILDKNTLFKNNNIKIDLNSIAKGYAVDQISLFLDNNDIYDYLVEIGGEVRTNNVNRKDGWIVGVQHPSSDEIIKKISLDNLSMATSGSYNNYFTFNNIEYSHILNPNTGYPFHFRTVSATIIADNCIDADAYATLAMTKNSSEIINLINNELGVEGYIIEIINNELIEYESLGFHKLTVF